MPIEDIATIRDRISAAQISDPRLQEILFPVRNLPSPGDNPDPLEAESVVRIVIKRARKRIEQMEHRHDTSFQSGLTLGERVVLISDLEELADGYHELSHSNTQ